MVQILFVTPAFEAKMSMPFNPVLATILLSWSLDEMLVNGVLYSWYVDAAFVRVRYVLAAFVCVRYVDAAFVWVR